MVWDPAGVCVRAVWFCTVACIWLVAGTTLLRKLEQPFLQNGLARPTLLEGRERKASRSSANVVSWFPGRRQRPREMTLFRDHVAGTYFHLFLELNELAKALRFFGAFRKRMNGLDLGGVPVLAAG